MDMSSDGCQKIRIDSSKTAHEKIDNMVNTFLAESNDGIRKIREMTQQVLSNQLVYAVRRILKNGNFVTIFTFH